MTEMMPARRTAVASAVLLVCALACSSGEPARSTSGPVSPRPAERRSQSVADARRDGIAAAVAALPFAQRFRATSTVRIDDETWAISRPTARGAARIGCADAGGVCGTGYGELVRLEERRIVRAYPFPGVPPQHIAMTDDAVYCAHQGDDTLPDSMVCRVDRRTHDLVVRIFPAEDGSAFADDRDLPDGWTIDDGEIAISKLAADDGGVWVKAPDAAWTRLDPDTLEIVERDIERVTTDP